MVDATTGSRPEGQRRTSAG